MERPELPEELGEWNVAGVLLLCTYYTAVLAGRKSVYRRKRAVLVTVTGIKV